MSRLSPSEQQLLLFPLTLTKCFVDLGVRIYAAWPERRDADKASRSIQRRAISLNVISSLAEGLLSLRSLGVGTRSQPSFRRGSFSEYANRAKIPFRKNPKHSHHSEHGVAIHDYGAHSKLNFHTNGA